MYISSRFNFLVVALITLVSLCAARTTITSQNCSTRFCDRPGKVLRTTKTIHKTIRYTITRGWMTSTKYKSTHTLTSTKYTTVTKYNTLKTVTITATKTTTQTLVPTYYATTPLTYIYTTTRIVTPTYTIPTPDGFVGVNNDPENTASPHYTALPDGLKREVQDGLDRRDPEPEAVAKAKYVAALSCTKTLITKTGTTDFWKTTTITATWTTALAYKTVTFTRTKPVTSKGAVTKHITTTKWTSVWGTSTSTIWTEMTTSHTTTYITVQETKTVRAACLARNQAPDYYGQTVWTSYDVDPYPDEKVVEIIAPGDPHTCCDLCHTYSGSGKCVGSVWTFRGPWLLREDCPDAWDGDTFLGYEYCPPDPDDNMRCQLIISEDEPATCRTHRFEFQPILSQRWKNVSNGPSCARFKYRAPGEPL